MPVARSHTSLKCVCSETSSLESALVGDFDLVPGGSYRLWVAFNKPMRIRNSSGSVVSYAGQSPGAAVGTVTIELPSLTGQDLALGGGGAWLNAPGGAPNCRSA